MSSDNNSKPIFREAAEISPEDEDFYVPVSPLFTFEDLEHAQQTVRATLVMGDDLAKTFARTAGKDDFSMQLTIGNRGPSRIMVIVKDAFIRRRDELTEGEVALLPEWISADLPQMPGETVFSYALLDPARHSLMIEEEDEAPREIANPAFRPRFH